MFASFIKAKAGSKGGNLLRDLKRDTRGVTAIEFAMVIVPFLATMFAIMEVSLVYFATFTLENATEQAARLIRTGQAQGQGAAYTADKFKEEVCNQTMSFMACNGNLRVDVRSFAAFGGVNGPAPLDANGQLKDNFESFSMGAGGDVVLVSVYYKWNLVASFPRFGLGVGNMADGSRLLKASVAFRNEPFDN